jgi:hypothetical protein
MRYKVYYRKLPTFTLDNALTVEDLAGDEFALVREVAVSSLDKVFCEMQGEVWSPNGEARELILSLGLHHTSMSVGDVAVDEGGRAWQCDIMGWKEVLPNPKRHKPRLEAVLS